MFGATKADVNHFVGMNLQQTLAELLSPSGIALSLPVNDYNTATQTDPDVPAGQVWINAPYNPTIEARRIISLRGWWLDVMAKQGRSIEEKMLLFLHNLVPIQMTIVDSGVISYNYLMTMRQHVLGNYKQMIRDITLDPAMLRYLNGYLNSNTQPDENYARELQELFTLGKDTPTYTEADVQAAARVLTGWSIDVATYQPIFIPSRHDTGPKQFSAFYNGFIIPGQSGPNAGDQELDALLDMIFTANEVALHICRELYRFFVYHEITAQTEQDVIVPLANIFRTNNYELLPVLEALFSSEHFFDPLNMGAMLKSPADFSIGFLRELDYILPSSANLSDAFNSRLSLQQFMSVLQQVPGDPPAVAGWPAYYQIPLFDKTWITTDSLPRRAQLVDYLIYVGMNLTTGVSKLDVLGYVASLDQPGDPLALIQEMVENLLPLNVSQSVVFSWMAILLSGQTNTSYWTGLWNDYVNDPTDPTKRFQVEYRLQALFHYIFHVEEYQLH
jgi:uncharacterized protein (DUF1800 family)